MSFIFSRTSSIQRQLYSRVQSGTEIEFGKKELAMQMCSTKSFILNDKESGIVVVQNEIPENFNLFSLF